MTWPGETNGIPNGLNVNFGGPLGAILPSAICGDMGPCDPIWGSTFAGGGTDCIYLGIAAGGLDFTGLDALFKVTNTGIKLDPSLKDAFKVFAEKGVEEGLGAVATNPALQVAIRTQLLSTGGKFSKKFIGKVAGDVSVGLLVLNSGTALYKAGKFYAGCVQ